MVDIDDLIYAEGPWLVRVIHNKVAVGVYFCPAEMLEELIDETCDPGECEVALLPSGGFVFDADLVLPDGWRYEELADDELEVLEAEAFNTTAEMGDAIDGRIERQWVAMTDIFDALEQATK